MFSGLWVHPHPTEEHRAYLVLSLDVSRVAADAGPELLRPTFLEAVRGRVAAFLLRYRDSSPPLGDVYARLDHFQDAEGLIGTALDVVSTTPYEVYLLIDEHDHFANRLLAGGSADLNEAAVENTGFLRAFYATLESGTSSGAVAGFTRADTERAVDELLAVSPDLVTTPGLSDRSGLLRVLEEYYNGYRFSEDAVERVFNSDMVLYFLRELEARRRYPHNMLDQNVRTEYGHLQRIGTMSGTAAADRRALLETILGEGHLRSELVEQFGVKSLASTEPFVSLLYFLGMLTLGPSPRDAFGYDLEIPNRVIRELQWEHLALLLQEEASVSIHLDELRRALGTMAVQGDIAPFLDLFQTQVLKALSNRDMRGLDEKTIKLLLMTYASLGRAFYPLSEKECNRCTDPTEDNAPRPWKPGSVYSGGGTVITPIGRSSSAWSRRARVADQRRGDSSRKRSRGQKGRMCSTSSR